MKETLLMIALVSIGNIGYSQYNKGFNDPKPVVSINDSWTFPTIEQFDGTFQFVVHEKKNFQFTTETFDLITTSRKEDEDVTLDLSPYISVFIPSKNSIHAATYVPFQSTYIIKN